MRIISGIYRGRSIKTPNPKFTRPTTSIVKESIFNMLQNSFEFSDALVLDIYAGSGSLGIEALSRGAGEVHFVEQNFSVYKILNANIGLLDSGDKCKVWKRNALKFSKMETHSEYNLILADPPFFKDDIHEVFETLLERNYLKQNGIFIIERSIQTQEKDEKVFETEPKKRIGDSLIYWYEN